MVWSYFYPLCWRWPNLESPSPLLCISRIYSQLALCQVCLIWKFDKYAIGHNLHNCRYDGQRAQIHKLVDGSVHIFSRNGDESTSRFPDLINIINQSCKPDALTFILDGEVKSLWLTITDTHSRSKFNFILVWWGTTLNSLRYVIFLFQVVGVDRKNGCRLMSFQELSSRGRGSRDASITLDSIKVNVFSWSGVFLNMVR